MTNNTAQVNPLDYPALDGRPVTEAHARRCYEYEHATHKVDGKDTGVCPRCGEVKTCNAMFCILDTHEGDQHCDATGYSFVESTPEHEVIAHVYG